MLMVRHVKAPAKINLHLEVCGKLPNGYHAIKSIFQTVPLYDELDIELTETENSCRVICEKMDLPENNTISKAYRKFCEASGIMVGTLPKQIYNLILKNHLCSFNVLVTKQIQRSKYKWFQLILYAKIS